MNWERFLYLLKNFDFSVDGGRVENGNYDLTVQGDEVKAVSIHDNDIDKTFRVYPSDLTAAKVHEDREAITIPLVFVEDYWDEQADNEDITLRFFRQVPIDVTRD